MQLAFLEFQIASTVGEFALNAAIGALGRALDLLSPHYVTRQMVLETNRRLQRAVWRGTALL